jgi:hypothetical protein
VSQRYTKSGAGHTQIAKLRLDLPRQVLACFFPFRGKNNGKRSNMPQQRFFRFFQAGGLDLPISDFVQFVSCAFAKCNDLFNCVAIFAFEVADQLQPLLNLLQPFWINSRLSA